MCGIGALIDPAEATPTGAGERMARALRHRGPDGHAVLHRAPATLVHTRLAIIDVAGGDQPLASEDGRVEAVVNGEIYNHRELRADLERCGHRFATDSDSEVIVHGYEQEGPDFVRRLNGMFAFALWDQRSQTLVAARDPFGVKPLYWWSDGRRLALASEVGALLEAGMVEPAVDGVALDHFIACRFVPAPRTMFAGVSKLAAASLMVARAGEQPRIESFRSPPSRSDQHDPEHLAEAFRDAVQRQMMSDVPYGALLSGGVDSAAIVAAMRDRSGSAPKTFTIGFPGHGDVLDERSYAAETARVVGTEHHQTTMVEGDFPDELARCVRRLEEPCGIPSAPALMALSRFAAGSVKVVLSGQGADEPHGGYGRHRAAALLSLGGPLASALGRPASAAAALAAGNERVRRAARLAGRMSDATRLMRLVEITGSAQREALSGSAGEQAAAERSALAAEVIADVGDRPLLDRALYLDSHLLLGDGLLICADKMSMASGLEQRVPFLDLELMRTVESLPASARAGVRRGKALHRAAVARMLPESIVERPKHGFSTPYDSWLRTSLGDEVRRRYRASDALAQMIDPGAVDQLLDAHRSGRADHKRVLYCLLELAQWHETFVEPAGIREPAQA